jgi:cytochrome c
MHPLRVAVIAIDITLAACDPAPTGDAAYGEYLASECVTCHGSDANASIPPLRTLRYEELITALKAYRDGTRTNAVMRSVARSLGDAEIEALAAHFAGQR